MTRRKETLAAFAERLGVAIPESVTVRSEPFDARPANDRVRDLIPVLEVEKFATMADRPTWDALNEVQALAREQLSDDLGTTSERRDRIGRGWVESSPSVGAEGEEGEPLWEGPTYGPEQFSLEAGFRGFLPQLTGKQRDVLRLLFWPQTADGRPLTERDAAGVLGITRDSTRDRVVGALKALSKRLRAVFIPEGEDTGTKPRVALRSAEEGSHSRTGQIQPTPGASGLIPRPDLYGGPPVPRQPVGHLTFGGVR